MRSDNLTQHLRTYERLPGGIGSPFTSGGSGTPRGSVGGGDDGDVSGGEGSLNEDSSSRHGSLVGDSEDEGIVCTLRLDLTNSIMEVYMCMGILWVVVPLWICRPMEFWVVPVNTYNAILTFRKS